MRALPQLYFCLRTLVWLLFAVATATLAAPVTLKLTDGSIIKGEVVKHEDGEVTVRADYGVVRLKETILTPETRAALAAPSAMPREAELLKRIAELEKAVALLQAENADLRKQLAAAAQSPATPPVRQGIATIPRAAAAGTAEEPTATATHWMTSSSSKRHNSRCRYFRTSRGRPCDPNDGIACKICGG